MEPSSSSQTINCIGKCDFRLKCDHLDKMTDNVMNTLEDKEGVKIFKEYIKENSTKENYDCVELYETCNEYLKTSGKKERQIKSRIKTVLEKVKDLDGVAGLNLALQKRMYEIESRTDWKNEAFDILSEIARCCLDHLRSIHESFKRYMAKSCPSIK